MQGLGRRGDLSKRRAAHHAASQCEGRCADSTAANPQPLPWQRLASRARHRGPRLNCRSLPLFAVCLSLWPMDKISNADAYTLEQVRRADYATNCGLGFAGLQCNQVTSCEELDYCSGHGICQRGGFCICDPGWEGATCKQSNCPSLCSGHGSCAASGGCVCDAGFTGVICNHVICLGGGNCTGHGACLSGGICECEKGYLGGACDKIDVAQKCSNNGVPKLACHGKLRMISTEHQDFWLRAGEM
jgi:hypothetical protein